MKTLPAEFISYWRHLLTRMRGSKSAHRALLFQWRSGSTVPGYPPLTEGQKRPVDDLPEGWSYANLLRYRPSTAELQLRSIRPVSN